MRLRAMAKINLALDVLGKRPDGYHDVRMIMQTISMYDALDIQIKKEPGIELSTNLPYVPADSRNLAYKAADLLMQEFDIKEGLQIHLEKFIPVSAGMAGGSSDAAAVLVGVNNLFRLGLSKQELMKRGSTLGADIPYCVMRGTALAEGIGEKLTPLPSVPECFVLVGKPSVSVSTKAAYESLRLDAIDRRPDIDGMIESLKTGDLTEMLASGNDEHIEKVFRVMEAENHFRTSYGLQLLNANDSMENLNYDFAGLPQIYEQCLLDMAGAAEIPATKLFGRSPQGMNATGESDMRNYYEVIASRQERDLRPVLEKLLPVMAMSCWGYVPEDLQIRFEPMTPLSTGDQIHQAKEHSEMLVQLFQAGAITKEELREEMIEWSGRHGVLTKLKGKAGPNHK